MFRLLPGGRRVVAAARVAGDGADEAAPSRSGVDRHSPRGEGARLRRRRSGALQVGRFGVVLSLLLGVALLLPACRKLFPNMPATRYLRPRAAPVSMSTADARGRYDHQLHAATIAAHGQTCADCHRFDVVIETGEEALAKELSAHALAPGGAACHFCHGPDETKLATAPGACTLCHTNLAPLRPLNHDVAWARVHASVAQAQPGECDNCHKQSECITCHQTRDTIQTIVHERNFLFFHSIEARANPMQCGSCHREDYCIRCHQQGDVEVRP